MPSLQRVRKQAKGILCQSNLKQWGTIFTMYVGDNNGHFPRRTQQSGRWMDAMVDYYITTEDIRLCSLVTKLANPDGINGIDFWGDTFLGWGKIPPVDAAVSTGRTIGFYGSYGVNGYIYVPGEPVVYKPAAYFWKSFGVKGASDIPMMLDCYFWCGWPDDDNTPPEYDGWQQRDDNNAMNRYFLDRHDGFINAIFLDYTVRKVGLKELFTLRWHREFNRANAWTTAGGVMSSDWKNFGDGWMGKFKDY